MLAFQTRYFTVLATIQIDNQFKQRDLNEDHWYIDKHLRQCESRWTIERTGQVSYQMPFWGYTGVLTSSYA
jgi:hypothetical protein